jgi:predicted DNA-binding ribbon-helix-helix protein
MNKQNLYRTQVLLEPQQYQQLTALAETEGISLSALLRRMVAQALDARRSRIWRARLRS